MGKYYFPAIFDPGTDDEQGFTITFSDLPGCITEGSDMNEAVYMAKDVLAGFLYGMEEDEETIPTPSDPSSIDLPQGAFISIIEVRTDYIRDEIENKAIKKTLTIPKWLNDAAVKERLGIIRKEHFILYNL